MKKQMTSGGQLGRRSFLEISSAGLALMGLPFGAPNMAATSTRVGDEINPRASIVLAQKDRPASALVVPRNPSILTKMAQDRILRAVKRHANTTLDALASDGDLSLLRDRTMLIMGTPQNNPIISYYLDQHRISLGSIGANGYVLRSWTEPGSAGRILLAANSDKGVYHGAAHLADYYLESDGSSLASPMVHVESKPAIQLRGTYNLTCWNLAPRYSLGDWKKVIDAMTEDHMNFIYFWLAGLFRSRKFPEAFIYHETPLTNDDIHELIRYAQDRGIDFYLGSGAFAWFGQDQIGMYNPQSRELDDPHICRTLPFSRQMVTEYLTELHETFPEADGMYLEIGCEGDYHCEGPLCQKPLDEFGSKQIGKSELSFLSQFSTRLWKSKPKLKFVWPIGYPVHQWDVHYYDALRRSMTDPRYFWMEARQNWQLPDSTGVQRDLSSFSKNILHWDQYYALPLLDIRDRARRVAEAGIAGYVVAFEPGFATASIYGNRIPFPVDLIPYCLSRFAYREFTWDPEITWSEFKARVRRRFFPSSTSDDLVDMMITLRELMRAGELSKRDSSLYADCVPFPGKIASFGKLLRPRLDGMQAQITDQRARLSGVAGEGIELLETCIRDLRDAYRAS